MSDESPEESKTEAASQRRLDQMAEEGQLPLGKDLPSVAALAGGLLLLAVLGSRLGSSLIELCSGAVRGLAQAGHGGASPLALTEPALLSAAVCAAAAAASAAAVLAQTQGRLWGHLALPDFSRLAEGSRLTRLVSKDLWIDLAAAGLKVSVLAWVAWRSLRGDVIALEAALRAPMGLQFEQVSSALAEACAKVVAAWVVLAGADLALTRYRYFEKAKMTREEIKREHREDEGDPLIRSRRKKRHRELLKHRLAVDVPRADAIVVNPTHIAIAIRYRRSEGGAPRVLFKGKGALAETIREVARANGIPIVQDIALARLLYKRVKVGGAVPAETYKAVAAVLATVYRLLRRDGQGAQA